MQRGVGRRLRTAVPVGLMILLTLTGCTTPGAPIDPAVSAVPAADLAALRSTVEEINAVDGDIADQRAVLQRLAADDQQAAQRRCAAATTTVRFEPVWVDAAPRPGHPGSYLVPTVIRIRSGGRTTGTDLAALTLTIDAGIARTTALCVT